MKQVIIGIDIAKDTFTAAFVSAEEGTLFKEASYANAKGGYAELIREAGRYQAAHVVMEATGNYHLHLSCALLGAELTQSIVNPLQVKRFAQMKLRRVKTDRSDAALIARYGQEQEPAGQTPPPEAQAKLKQISTLIDQLTKQHTALKNQQHATEHLPASAHVCDDVLEEQLGSLQKHLQRLKEEQERLAEDQFTHVKELAQSVIGIGPRTACTLLAYAGDLSSFSSDKQLAAFMGLNPVVQESGTIKKQARISKQGHKKLRTLFYMAAQSARLYNNACRALYERLIDVGKPKKVALIAVANKLVKQVFAVVKHQSFFDNDLYLKLHTQT